MCALIAASLSSCGIGSNLTSNQNSLQTEVVLSQNNYKVVKSIKGEANATYIFGIGGLSSRALKNNAIAEMYKNAKLEGKAQALVNTQISVRIANILGVYMKKHVTAEAHIIEFND